MTHSSSVITSEDAILAVERVLPEEEVKDSRLKVTIGLPVAIGHCNLVDIRQQGGHEIRCWCSHYLER